MSKLVDFATKQSPYVYYSNKLLTDSTKQAVSGLISLPLSYLGYLAYEDGGEEAAAPYAAAAALPSLYSAYHRLRLPYDGAQLLMSAEDKSLPKSYRDAANLTAKASFGVIPATLATPTATALGLNPAIGAVTAVASGIPLTYSLYQLAKEKQKLNK